MFGVFFFCCVSTFVAISPALLGVRATDTFFTALLSANDIEYRSANNKHDGGDGYIINDTHNYTLRARSFFSSLFFLMITAVNIVAMESTIAQPSIGIQVAPNEPFVKSVPKKNTRKPTV